MHTSCKLSLSSKQKKVHLIFKVILNIEICTVTVFRFPLLDHFYGEKIMTLISQRMACAHMCSEAGRALALFTWRVSQTFACQGGPSCRKAVE